MLHKFLRTFLLLALRFNAVGDEGAGGDAGEDAGATGGAFDTDAATGGAFDLEGEGTGDEGAAGDKKEGDDDDPDASKSDDDKGDAASKKEGAPEAYEDFQLPEGTEAIAPLMDVFKAEAKEAGLSQEQAQAQLTNLATWKARIDEHHATEATDHWQQQANDWSAQSKAQGVMTQENMALAGRGLSMLDSTDSELGNTLSMLGLNKHPAIIRAFASYGRQHGDAEIHDGNLGGSNNSPESVLYDHPTS